MKRVPMTHDRVFSDEAFAERYAKHHDGMVAKFGRGYAAKLSSRGFQGGRIIDLGCGSGATVIVLARAFPQSEAVGLDLSEPLLRWARTAAREAGVEERVRFENADVQRVPYEDDSFDVVVNLNMVHVVEDPVRMLDEIERILSPDGFLFIADLRRSWLGLVEKEIKSALTLGEARELLRRSRLREGTFSSSPLWWRFEA